jgi:hypothetical protein
MSPPKPFSQACENNKDAILAVLKTAFAEISDVLELASGTGQHSCYFAQHLPHLTWQPSDLGENLSGINSWVNDSKLSNIMTPVELDVCWQQWPLEIPVGIFSANSLHIMSWGTVQRLFEYLSNHAPVNNCLCLYGPFNYKGAYTSESNRQFDQWLKQHNSLSGIRDFEAVGKLAQDAGYCLKADYQMPANNQLLQWHKQ